VPSETRKHSGSLLDPVPLLQELIRFDTSNPPGNERACLEYLTEILGIAGIECRLVAREHERPNLLARVPGDQSTPPLLLYGHVDVVPARAEEWKQPPFGGDLIDDAV